MIIQMHPRSRTQRGKHCFLREEEGRAGFDDHGRCSLCPRHRKNGVSLFLPSIPSSWSGIPILEGTSSYVVLSESLDKLKVVISIDSDL